MNKFKFIIWLIIFSLFFSTSVFANWCSYKSQIDQCNTANKNWTTKSIEDFVCITGTNEQVAYQVILDWEFKKLDKQMDKFIEDLEEYKNVYFWRNRQKTYIDWINDIHSKRDYFYKEYKKLCWINIIEQSIACMNDWRTSIQNAKQFFSNKWTPCEELINKKLEIYDDIAFSVLMFNKQQIKEDDKKTYDQWQRRNYNKLIDIMMINLWYLERIWQKWPSKLANPL
jgi:hypothetical protein